MGFQNSIRVALVCAVVASIATTIPRAVRAAYIDYGDFTAATVVYKGVSEASVTDPLPLYGSPTVSVDSLSFNLRGVGAFNIAAGGGGFDIVDGQLLTTIQAMPSQKIAKVTIQEHGDFSLLGVGTSLTNVQVSLVATLRVREIDGVAVNPLDYIYTQTMTFNPTATTDGKYTLTDYPGSTQPWNGTLEFDLDSLIPGSGLATLLDVTFDNSLFAYSEANSAALIMKKMVDVSATTVPEPGTFVLLLLGAAGLGGYAWRRRRASTMLAAA